jgi:hypothetical protein
VTKRYFWDDPRKKPLGLNADIERHRKEAQKLDEWIAEAEQRPRDRMTEACIRTYRHCRYLLDASMANVVNKLGRKK